jgi:hypothetical protein
MPAIALEVAGKVSHMAMAVGDELSEVPKVL